MVLGGLYESTAVAAKVPISLQGRPFHGKDLRVAANELCILRRLRHPNVVAFFGAVLIGDGDPSTDSKDGSSLRHEDLPALGVCCTGLQRIDLRHCEQVSDAGLRPSRGGFTGVESGAAVHAGD